MKDNQRLIIVIVGSMGLLSLMSMAGLAFLERPVAISDDLSKIAFGVLTFFGGMGVEKVVQAVRRASDPPMPVVIEQPPGDPVPVDASR